jgi:hypothetical protein
VVGTHGSDHAKEFYIVPGQVDLVWKEATSGRRRIEVVVVVPFSCHVSRPELVNGKVFAVKVCAFFSFVFAFSMSFIIKGAYTNTPETCSAK